MEFQGWPKTPRLNRDMTITEKIDGTNAAVIIECPNPEGDYWHYDGTSEGISGNTDVEAEVALGNSLVVLDDVPYLVGAQSRKRLIYPGKDNAGFAQWVSQNAEGLVKALGEGRHFGEWWGKGIQRNYGMDHKEFSLFNVVRYSKEEYNLDLVENLSLVPMLWAGPFDTATIQQTLDNLEYYGSRAAPGFMDPEGIIIFHEAAQSVFKVTIRDDERPKGI